MGVDYYEYIQSEEWRQRAKEAKRLAGNRCRICNRSASQVTLDAHHRTYDRLGHEDPDDITVLCRDCHELFEMNKKASRSTRQQVTYQRAWVAPSYTVKQTIPSNEDVSLAKRDSITPWRFMAVVFVGMGALIFLAWSAAVLFPLSPQPTNPTQPSVSNAPEQAHQLVSTVNRPAVVCSNACSCAPVARTITRGAQVTVIETTSCSGETWYRIGDKEWLGPGVVGNSTQKTTFVPASGSITRQPTPTNRPTRTVVDGLIESGAPTATPLITTPDCVGGCVEYPSWCAPPIKGNVIYNTGEKIYHLPGQEYYDETKISPSYGERWFCAEQEARAAGWRKSRR